jgi:hypothetical protein
MAHRSLWVSRRTGRLHAAIHQLAVGAMMLVFAPGGSASACPALSPPSPTDVPRGLPSEYDAGRGTNRIVVFVVARRWDEERVRQPNRRVRLRCADAEIELATNSAGVALFRGMPAGECLVSAFDPLGRVKQKQWTMPPDSKWGVTLVEPWAPSTLPRSWATALPADVVLERHSSSCLNSCRSFTATLHADGRVVFERTRRNRNRSGRGLRRGAGRANAEA